MSIDHGARWEVGLDHYQAYIRETAGTAILVDYVCADGFRLGVWINTQRVERRRQQLRPERFELLDAIGIQWDPQADLLDAMTRALREFSIREGHAEIPALYRTADGLPLGNWVRIQRLRYKKGTLGADLIAEFESVGVSWDKMGSRFSQGLAELAKFVRSSGSTHVPKSHVTSSGFALGTWFQIQKSAMSRDMPPDRRRSLESLGIRPDGDVREEAWQSAFEALRSWVAEFGHASVPKDYINEDGFRLGQWLGVQRAWLSSGRLKENRRSQLDSLMPGWPTAKPKWANDKALDALRTAATMAFPLRGSDYSDLRSQRLVSGPSLAWFIQSFGSWSSACQAADVEAGASSEGWTPYREADVSQALQDFFEAHDDNATSDDYITWAHQSGAPGIGPVLRRQGNWTAIRRRFGSASAEEPFGG